MADLHRGRSLNHSSLSQLEGKRRASLRENAVPWCPWSASVEVIWVPRTMEFLDPYLSFHLITMKDNQFQRHISPPAAVLIFLPRTLPIFHFRFCYYSGRNSGFSTVQLFSYCFAGRRSWKFHFPVGCTLVSGVQAGKSIRRYWRVNAE